MYIIQMNMCKLNDNILHQLYTKMSNVDDNVLRQRNVIINYIIICLMLMIMYCISEIFLELIY